MICNKSLSYVYSCKASSVTNLCKGRQHALVVKLTSFFRAVKSMGLWIPKLRYTSYQLKQFFLACTCMCTQVNGCNLVLSFPFVSKVRRASQKEEYRCKKHKYCAHLLKEVDLLFKDRTHKSLTFGCLVCSCFVVSHRGQWKFYISDVVSGK